MMEKGEADSPFKFIQIIDYLLPVDILWRRTERWSLKMGPKNACSYADLAMGLIDEKAKLGGASKPMLWWRYRDDVFDLWTLGLPKLLEFTEYINSLYPTIKFELVYSESSLNVLDLILHLQDGFIITDIYAKPTDSHLYLPFSSSHPSHCKRAIPYGVALRIKRNCSTDQFLNKRCEEYKGYLCSQNYSKELVDRQFEKALSNERSELLTKRVKPKKKVFPLVLDYNPILPDIQQVIKKHSHLLRLSPELLEIFPSKSIFPAYRRTKNLKEILAPSKFRKNEARNETLEDDRGCCKCNKRCDLCKNFLIQDTKFESFATGRIYRINQKLSCTSKNVIYLAACNKCKSSTWAPLQQNSRFVFVTINHQCLRTEEHVSWWSIIILLSIKFVKLVLLLSNKL